MTVAEMRRLLLLKFEGLFDLSAPAYSNQQLSDVLNNAQRRIVRDVDSPNPQKNYGGFGYTERVRKYLAPLLKTSTLVATTGEVFPNGDSYTVPPDCWYFKQEQVTMDGSSVGVIPQTLDFYSANINNPYKQPDSEDIWRLDTGDKLVELILPVGSSVTEYKVTYMQEVPDLDIDTPTECILHEDLHDDIVDEAYKMMTGASTPETYQIANNEANNN